MSKPPLPYKQLPVTEERKRLYLEELAVTGSHAAAARAATPHGTGKQPGGTTWRELRKRDPAFEADCNAALSAALGLAEKTAFRNAINGSERYALDKDGNPVLVEKKPPDPRFTLAVLRRLNPEGWTEKHRVEHSGTVVHSADDTLALITYDDVAILPEQDRVELARLLRKVSDARAERDPAVIEHQPDA